MKHRENADFIRKNEDVKKQKDVVDDYLLKTSICQKTVPVIVEDAQQKWHISNLENARI